MDLLLHLGIFIGAACLDLLFVLWTRSIVGGRRTAATLATGGFYTIAATVTYAYAGNPSLIPAFILGHMVGTWLGVKDKSPESEVVEEAA